MKKRRVFATFSDSQYTPEEDDKEQESNERRPIPFNLLPLCLCSKRLRTLALLSAGSFSTISFSLPTSLSPCQARERSHIRQREISHSTERETLRERNSLRETEREERPGRRGRHKLDQEFSPHFTEKFSEHLHI